MCWIIPIIVGIVSAFLGYLSGRSNDKNHLAHLRLNNEELRKKLDSYELENAQQRQAAEEQADAEKVITAEDVIGHEAYQALQDKLNETETTLAERVTELEQVNTEPSDETIENHAHYQALLSKHQDIQDKLKQAEAHQTAELTDSDIESHSHYKALQKKYAELQQLFQETEKQPSEAPQTVDITKHPAYSELVSEVEKLVVELEKVESALTEQKYETEKALALSDAQIKSHPIYRALLDKYHASRHALDTQDTDATTEVVTETETPKTEADAFDAKLAQSVFGKKIRKDDLTVIDGIGTKIEQLFKVAGVLSWQDLADTTVDKCYDILEGGGTHFTMHDPKTWPEQARLAADGKWQALLDWQNERKKQEN